VELAGNARLVSAPAYALSPLRTGQLLQPFNALCPTVFVMTPAFSIVSRAFAHLQSFPHFVGGGERMGQFGGPQGDSPPRVDGGEDVGSPAKLIQLFPAVSS
jgi:hypothetical protein